MIHYELPNNSEIFVHRSGRTGRAGKTGSAILIYTRDQARNVQIIERDVGCKFTEVKINLLYIIPSSLRLWKLLTVWDFGACQDRV